MMNSAPFSERMARIGRLTRKELSEILRDRRTIITLILMPLLLYPLLSVAFQQFFLASGLDAKQQPEYKLAFLAEGDVRLFYKHFSVGNALLQRSAPPTAKPVKEPKLVPFAPDDPSVSRLEEIVKAGAVHLAIVVKNHAQIGRDQALDYEAIFLADSPSSRDVLEYVERRLAAANVKYLEDRVGRPGPPIARLEVHRKGLTRPDGPGGISLPALIPLILILMTITGAVYPAIDLTAGERERGTLEILVAAPVPRMGLLFAKYVSVVTVALLTALVNLVMMVITLHISGLEAIIFTGGLSVLLILQIFGLLLLFAAFFSAVLLTLSSFARSFKEAQAYLIPLMLVSLAPGLVGIFPDLKLTGIFSVLPLVNIVLLGRDLFQGNADPALAMVVVLSTLSYAAAAIAVAARIFGSESVLYNEQTGWADLFRKPSEVHAHPTIASAMLCYALSFPMLFLIQGMTYQHLREVIGPEGQLVVKAIGSVMVFAALPLVVAALRNVRVSTAFRSQPFSVWSVLGAALLGPALVLPTRQLLAFMHERGLILLSGQESSIRDMLSQLREASPIVVVGCLVTIGIVEEWFFRGFLFSALRSISGPAFTILASAVLFGFLHFVFMFDRLVTSTLLGLVLAWVAYQSGSVVPSMVLHGTFNALLISMAHLHEEAVSGPGWEWWAASLGGLAFGLVLVYLGRRPSPTT